MPPPPKSVNFQYSRQRNVCEDSANCEEENVRGGRYKGFFFPLSKCFVLLGTMNLLLNSLDNNN